jgi:DNA-binding NarL/FixJ family response regulator
MPRNRILLADDHTLLMETLKPLLEPEFEVAGIFADGRALLEAAGELKPELIVLDVSMPLLNGIDAGRRIKHSFPRIKLVYLTMSHDPDLAAEAFRIGASGYVLKSCGASELIHAIREALRGRSYVTPLVTQGLVGSFTRSLKRNNRTNKLTLRQREVLQLLAEGLTMKEVASKLDVSPRTVAFHKYTMMDQLHLRNSAELVQFAVRSSLVSSASCDGVETAYGHLNEPTYPM